MRQRVRQHVQRSVAGVARRRLRDGPPHPAKLRRLLVPVEVQRQAPSVVRGRRGDGAVLLQVRQRAQRGEGCLSSAGESRVGRRRGGRGGHVHWGDVGADRQARERGGGA